MCNATRSNANISSALPSCTCVFSPHWQGNRGVWGTWGPRSQAVWGTAEPVARPLSRRLPALPLRPRRPQAEHTPAADRKSHGRCRKAPTPFLTPLRQLPAQHLGAEATGWRHSRACGAPAARRQPLAANPYPAKERDPAFSSAAWRAAQRSAASLVAGDVPAGGGRRQQGPGDPMLLRLGRRRGCGSWRLPQGSGLLRAAAPESRRPARRGWGSCEGLSRRNFERRQVLPNALKGGARSVQRYFMLILFY